MAGEDRVGEPVGRRVHRLAPPAVALALSVVLVLIGGRALKQPAEFDMPGPEDFAVSHDPVASTSAAPDLPTDVLATESQRTTPAAPDAASGLDEPASEVLLAPPPAGDLPDEQFLPDVSAPEPADALAASRQVAPAGAAPSGVTELQREAPRDPLSQLSLALPPEPTNPWAGKPLFRPVATESAVFESGVQTISIDGVDSIGPEETCSHAGADWACGVRARAAFRAWLRGRAVVCQLPEGQDEAAMRGKCRLAKEDVGEWLVENGWAFAAAGGPYVQAGEKARAEGRGVFGAPPDTSGVGDVPDVPAGALPPIESQSIMTEDSAEAPQADSFQPTDPRMAFPPAPPAP